MFANNLVVIIIFGALSILSFLLFTNPQKVNTKANLWFASFLILWATYWLEEIFTLSGAPGFFIDYLPVVHFIQYFTPICFYLSILYYANPDYKFKSRDIKLLILPIIFGVVLFLKHTTSSSDVLERLLVGLIICQALIYTGASYLSIKKHKQKILLFSSNTTEIDLRWLENIIIAIIVLCIFITFYNILFTSANLNLFANIVSLSIIFFIGYNALKQKEIFNLDENERKQVININTKPIHSPQKKKLITDKELSQFKNRLSEVMENEKLYTDGELTLKKLANILAITPHQLSYVINEGFNENFFMYVNRHRVEKAKALLNDESKNHLSMIGIAYEAGFNSKTSFNTTFKKITGLTPSQFKKSGSTL